MVIPEEVVNWSVDAVPTVTKFPWTFSRTNELVLPIDDTDSLNAVPRLLVPSVETGNGLVKMMIYFMGACAAGVVVGGKVPVVITSRSDEAQARLASIAAAVVALD